MFASFLITFREVLEASLIIATFLGILIRFHQRKHIRFIWMSAILAGLVTAAFLGFFSVTGFHLQEVFEEEAKELFEGSMMLVSSVFVTWSVFWLHAYFGKHKMQVLQKIRETTEQQGA
ncbi:MAG TPA: FTR1 family protein, partial [Patescibacteria group bacterium]|nr:FTR1 family protein [Patescibacteria group bacterium]